MMGIIIERLEGMLDEGEDVKKRLRICVYEPKGIRVETDDLEEPYWFNRHEYPEMYDDLMGAYETPTTANGLPRISGGVCSIHRNLVGTESTSSSQ